MWYIEGMSSSSPEIDGLRDWATMESVEDWRWTWLQYLEEILEGGNSSRE